MSASRLYLSLLVIGAVWGLTIPLIKIAAGGGHHTVGLVFWQLVISTLALGVMLVVQRTGLSWRRRDVLLYLYIAFIGTLIPNSFSFTAAAHLPAGILAIGISMVPLFAMPVALGLGLERPEARRFLGVGLGALAILLIAGPDSALPEGIEPVWVLVALVAPFCYAFEGNVVAKVGTGGLSPVQLLFSASLIGTIIAAPYALTGGRFIPLWPMGVVELAIIGNGLFHAAAYAGYLFLISRAGPVFSSQTAYLVTGSGVVWSMILLGERYSLWVWLAFAILFAGVALVQPKRREAA